MSTYKQVPLHSHGVKSHHQPMQAASHLQELEDQELRGTLEGMISASHGA